MATRTLIFFFSTDYFFFGELFFYFCPRMISVANNQNHMIQVRRTWRDDYSRFDSLKRSFKRNYEFRASWQETQDNFAESSGLFEAIVLF